MPPMSRSGPESLPERPPYAPPARPTAAPAPARQVPAGRRPRHPSHGARAVALAASLASTVSVAVALDIADRTGSSSAVSAGATPRPTSSPAASGVTTSTVDPNALRDGVWTGPAEYTRWGYVQVQAKVKGGRLVDVVALQSPTGRRSDGINAQAQPILEAQAIAQQDADLDVVSGATYTSRTYTASLQAALDQARPAAATPSLRS